ncbi:MAG TPA: hypothetical protein VK395_27700 [Gemmataceae bacterium]|nr:hypothetical protein [Gemmataceae bacterium]
MPKKLDASTQPIHLTFRSVESVLVEPDDEDRFMTTSQEAAFACKQASDKKEWQEDFKRFLHAVSQWCESHKDDVHNGCVGVGDGLLNIFIRTKHKAYNFDLEDELTQLDIDLVKKFPWLVAEVMQLPSNINEDQLFSENAIIVFGDGRSTQGATGV